MIRERINYSKQDPRAEAEIPSRRKAGLENLLLTGYSEDNRTILDRLIAEQEVR